MPKCCVIIPCYNEHDRILADEFITFLNLHADFTFIFIDDGSSDETFLSIETLSNQHERIYSYRLNDNCGKAEAVRYGFLKSKELNEFDYYAYLDADLAIPLSELIRLKAELNKNKSFEFCYSSKKPTKKNELNQSFKRVMVGRTLAQMVKWSLRVNVYDTQCGCKMMTRTLAEVSFKDEFISAWLFDIEIFWRLINKFGKQYIAENTKELPLEKLHNRGSSNVKIVDLIKLPIEFYKIHNQYKQK